MRRGSCARLELPTGQLRLPRGFGPFPGWPERACARLREWPALLLGDNSIADLSLSGLTSLEFLRLNDNSITDVSALSGLTTLTLLNLYNTSIADISTLRGLTSLEVLILANNSITDIGALSRLTSLTELYLFDNPSLSNIQPLRGSQEATSSISVPRT